MTPRCSFQNPLRYERWDIDIVGDNWNNKQGVQMRVSFSSHLNVGFALLQIYVQKWVERTTYPLWRIGTRWWPSRKCRKKPLVLGVLLGTPMIRLIACGPSGCTPRLAFMYTVPRIRSSLQWTTRIVRSPPSESYVAISGNDRFMYILYMYWSESRVTSDRSKLPK